MNPNNIKEETNKEIDQEVKPKDETVTVKEEMTDKNDIGEDIRENIIVRDVTPPKRVAVHKAGKPGNSSADEDKDLREYINLDKMYGRED